MKIMKLRQLLLLMAALLVSQSAMSQVYVSPKREFRGAWIQAVNGQWIGMTTQQMQQTLTTQLNALQRMGANVIIFQVRPECDALYASDIEPWSRFLTGQQGRAPQPYWDPLQWMIDQCHARGMELHAWINPYRAKTKTTSQVSTNHICITHPERVFNYDGLLILNPGMKENRDYICSVVADIVSRYDVDGIHYDDYFYPYPVAGQTIPDDDTYMEHPQGYTDRGDWRRHQVNLFVREVYETVHHIKPWVKVGVSPFGIYRNLKNDPKGSRTNGLQNYDDLYADILHWIDKGWVDYNVPQIYWEIGHRAADYDELIHWWNEHASKRPLVIGEDIERTVKHNQQARKMALYDECPNVKGTVLWYAKAAVDDIGGYATQLQQHYWSQPVLQPEMPFITKTSPRKPRKLKDIWVSENEHVLFWTAPRGSGWKREPVKYLVYRFADGEKVDTSNFSHLVASTTDTFVRLPLGDGSQKYTYVVTAINRLHNESKARKIKVRI